MARIAIVGGTGAEGEGLALRLALAGHEIAIGSRGAERAAAKAQEIRQRLLGLGVAAAVSGCANVDCAAGAEVVFLVVPWEGVETLLPGLRPGLGDKLVVDVVNPIAVEGGGVRLLATPAGSAAETIRRLAPECRLVSAFKTSSAEHLQRVETELEGDVLVCSDDVQAKTRVIELAAQMPHLRGVDAGPLANARYVEGLTALLLDLNRRHRALASIRVLGLP